MAGFFNFNNDKNKSFLRRIANFKDGGWDYLNNIVKHSIALGSYEAKSNIQSKVSSGAQDLDYSDLLYDLPGEYKKDTVDVTYDKLQSEYVKNEYLENIASFDEIDFVLTAIADEAIVYDTDGMFASVNTTRIKSKFLLKDLLIKSIEETFNYIYFLFKFNDTTYAWRLFKDFLIYGRLAFEIVYNTNRSKIIGFKRLDPFSLKMKVTKVGNKFVKYWVQYEGQGKNERQLSDDEIIYIAYNDTKGRRSYLESIMRNFNILKTLEDTRAIWGIMNSVMRIKMTVPINTKSEQRAKVKVGELRNRYKENIVIDKTSGQISINGKTDLQLYKNYIFPVKDGEQIEIEPVINNLSDAISVDELQYFSQKFIRNTKIPASIFDKDSGSTFSLDTALEHEQIRFNYFIERLRNTFKEILLKPLKIQLRKDRPELVDDIILWNSINIVFNKNNMFEELKEIEIMTKRIDFIQSLADLNIRKWDKNVEDFVEEPFFSTKYLIEKYLNLSENEISKNNTYKSTYNETKPEVEEDGSNSDEY